MKARAITWAIVALAAIAAGGRALADDDRILELNGVLNTRDLGGLQTEDGRSVRLGQVIRSGEIDGIDPEGLAALDRMGVSAVVDLRTRLEAAATPAEWPEGEGPERYNVPLMDREHQDIEDMRASIKAGTARAEETEALFYGAFADIPLSYTEELRDVFDVLMTQPEGASVLLHCSGGKDRTGVTTALFLSALGVTREDIEADFMMSNIQKDAENKAAEIAAEVNAAQGTEMTASAVWPTLGVRTDHLTTFYDSVAERYGSMENYLRDGLGLTETDLETLRARYLE